MIELDELETLRDFVWRRDIPHTVCPEYVEHHRDIQAILREIDVLIGKEVCREVNEL